MVMAGNNSKHPARTSRAEPTSTVDPGTIEALHTDTSVGAWQVGAGGVVVTVVCAVSALINICP